MNVVEIINSSAPLQSGRYVAVVADLPLRAISDGEQLGIGFTLKVTEGDAKGRLAAIELLVRPERDGRVARSLDVFSMWCGCLGVDNATTLTELIEKLRQAALGKRVEFTLHRDDWRGRLTIYLTAVRVLPEGGGGG